MRKPILVAHHNTIKAWIQTGESVSLDFKTQVTAPHKIARTMSAFANTKGGHLVIGVMDDGEIVGMVNIVSEQNKLLEAARHFCYPAVELAFEIHEANFLPVLVAYVKEASEKPIYAIDNSGDEKVYIRAKDKTMPASKMVIKNLETYNASTLEITRKLDSKEQALLDYLERNESTTVAQYMQAMNLSKRRAKRILTHLTLEGILRVHTTNKEDYYTL